MSFPPTGKNWQDDARCLNKWGIFEYNTETDSYPNLEEALAYCEFCPVKRQCAEAGKNEPIGIWGGIAKWMED